MSEAAIPQPESAAAGQPTAPASTLPREAYERAAGLIAHDRAELVLHAGAEPHWIGAGDSFWYRVRTADGVEFRLVDVVRRSRVPAFDHELLARALAAASGRAVDPVELPFSTIALEGETVSFHAFGSMWTYSSVDDMCCTPPNPPPAQRLELLSPDHEWAVFLRGFDLWLRSPATGEEFALTEDGAADRSYARWPDSSVPIQLLDKSPFADPPPIALWSPDSRLVLTHVTDQRDVQSAHLVEAAPPCAGRPRLHSFRYAMPGERSALGEWIVIDVETRRVVEVEADPFPLLYESPISWKKAWWSADCRTVYWLDQPRDLRTLWLKSIDPGTGEVSTLIEESGATRVEPSSRMGDQPLVHVLSSGREALWYSQRDDWGHLYLYDLGTGEQVRQLTHGEFVVESIVHVDEAGRRVYLTVAGLDDADPYLRALVVVGLDDDEFTRLTDDRLDHVVVAPSHGRWFVDSASTVEVPPVTTVRDRQGRVALEVERADVSRLVAAGWAPPERVSTVAADGKTPLYGVLYKPHGFDPDDSYAVIDHSYPGPQQCRVLPSFNVQSLAYFQDAWAEPVAALGFVVLAMDGRGTPGRSKSFHDYSYRNLGDCALEDHVAALGQLAQSRPWMDLDRVGMFGHSGGGFAAARALMQYPDTYKVAVAVSGNHDNRINHALWAETYDGPYDPTDPASDGRLSSLDLVEGLAGQLLLIHGDMDENVLLGGTARLVDALVSADKDFDMLVVPGMDHGRFGATGYVTRRTWDYFVRHLLRLQPPTYHVPEAGATVDDIERRLRVAFDR
jgi:dipeptidyl-peptidase-4